MNQHKIDYIDLRIIFADHYVSMEPVGSEKFNKEYLEEMAAELSPSGTAREHAATLRSLHNDGTWGIKRI